MNELRKSPNIEKPVLTFGEPLMALVHQEHGGLVVSRQYQAEIAGAELNTAIGLARLSIPVSFAGSLGDDPFGEWIIRELRAEGVDLFHLNVCGGHSSGVLFKQIIGLNKEPQVFYYRSTSPMGQGIWDVKTIENGLANKDFSWVHTSGITWCLSEETRRLSNRLLQMAKNNDISISFDINVRKKLASRETWLEILREVAPYSNWLLLGDSEANWLFGSADAEGIYGKLQAFGFIGQGIIIKQGENGADAMVGNQRIHVDSWPVDQVVDTVGAGDGFNAGWIAGMLMGYNMETSMQLGSIIGAYAVTTSGDSSGYPNLNIAMKHLNGQEEVAR
jgi:2-dehydro-3-deoxygluconokinase